MAAVSGPMGESTVGEAGSNWSRDGWPSILEIFIWLCLARFWAGYPAAVSDVVVQRSGVGK